MKYLKIILFLFFASQQLHAQYIPLVAENKYWFYERYYSSSDSGSPKVTSAYVHTLKGDTIIGGKIYKKVLELELEGTHHCQFPPCFQAKIPYIYSSKTIVGLISEDSSTKKTVFIPFQNGFCSESEHELFDFSLKKGDSLNTCMAKVLKPKSLPYPKVDSANVYFSFGKMRNIIFTVGIQATYGLIPIGQLKIVEGVGYERYGLFFGHFDKFCEGSLQDCKFSTATKNTINQAKIRVFPNPTTDKIIIESEENIESIHIYDINGKIITLDNQSNTINISHLSNGMYFIKIKFENGFQYFHKLIKQ